MACQARRSLTPGAHSQKFSIVTFYCTSNRPLTFENVCSGRWALDNRREFGCASAICTASSLTPSQVCVNAEEEEEDSTQASGPRLLVRESWFRVYGLLVRG